jgi:hypothetical protein
MQEAYIELLALLVTSFIFLFGIISLKGSAKDFKIAVVDLSGEFKKFTEKFTAEREVLSDRLTRQETICMMRRRKGDSCDADQN